MRLKNDENRIADELSGIAADTLHEARKHKSIIPMILGALCIIAVAFFATTIVPLIGSATAVGQTVGETSGSTVGMAVGSVEGVFQGVPSGYEEGKTEGLSAKDTAAEIATAIENNAKGLGSLTVLVANVDLTTHHEQGEKYEAVYLSRGKAVFTIDLNEMNVAYKEGIITITLPEPKAEFNIDPSETEVLAKWQKKYFNGTDSDGFQGYINSYIATENVTEDQIANYSELKELASASAKKQVEEIANAARGNSNVDLTVSVQSN